MSALDNPTCPACRASSLRVIWMGLPMYLCTVPSCSCVHGLWSWAPALLPFDGVMMSYEGSYWRALIVWWRTMGNEEGPGD